MEVLPITDDNIWHALNILRSGGVVAHATETCYGLACDLRNPEAVKKLFAVKKRPLHQPVSVLFSSLEEAKKYVEWNDEAEKLAKTYLPGPLTLVLLGNDHAPVRLHTAPKPLQTTHYKLLTVGVRLSSHPLAQQLVKEFGSPLSTTSANLHGQPNSYSAEDIVRQFSKEKFQPDLILDSGQLPPTPPSTVIDLTTKTDTVRRRGALNM